LVGTQTFYCSLLHMRFLFLIFLALTLIVFTSCREEEDSRFQLIDDDKTGIQFSNDLENTASFNILNYLYFYDGGGVSIGDINNDGLPDIYFTANTLQNRLYLNKGNFEFEDITSKAGVTGSADWTTGTTMVDINGDGLLDIYVSAVNYLNKSGRNQLFINNGDTTFTEQAAEYGLDFQGYSKQASFFDYDNDGDLDLYLLNHSVHSNESFANASRRNVYSDDAGDKLFRNDEGQFVDVTQEAGIYSSIIGYGLAATVSDINKDGCQDIYVSNDFHENDYLYMNNCDGTFREVIESSTGHTSRASMGTDIADFNNDGLADIFVLDMLPYKEEIRKSAVSSEPNNAYEAQRRFGYHPQLIRNTLQLNLGVDEEDNPLFSEIAQLAGVDATDWSWSALFFDMNNNGKKDLFVSNGIYRRPNDMDYLLSIRSEQAQQAMQGEMSDTALAYIENMPKVKIPNFGFINEGGYSFRQDEQVGFRQPSFSNGAAYGDLDNDGDLDLVVNNVNMKASIYRNMTREREERNYLKVRLHGVGQNTFGIGAKVTVHAGDALQYYEMMPTRGFLSSVEPIILAGLDSVATIDSVSVTWPNQSRQVMTDISVNQTLELYQKEASKDYDMVNQKVSEGLFNRLSDDMKPSYSHEENSFNDYNFQSLMPHKLSSQGPAIAVGDVNGDGLDDFYVGGAKYRPGALFIQDDLGSFSKSNSPVFEQDQSYEDVDAIFFDANNDGAPDLYVVSGGSEDAPQSNGYGDRLYVNDGEGRFARVADALPPLRDNGSVATAADYDGDGDMDLFIGNRSVPGNYGISPNSHILENDGNGRFSEVTDQVSEDLKETGMVTDATWQDVNGDGTPDLIVVGEWMPITIYLNKEGKLQKQTEAFGLADTHGWWNTVVADDFDKDGDMDFMAGNIGLNTDYKASYQEPLKLYLKDFNGDGQVDPIITYMQEDKEYPVATRDDLLSHFHFLRSRYPGYGSFAGQTIRQIFGDRLNEGVEMKKATLFSSVFLENEGNGTFTIHNLPQEIQFAPVFAIATGDFDDDWVTDALLGGNFFDVKPSMGGRYDASYGWFLKGNGDGNFRVSNPLQSGFVVDGEIRDIQLLNTVDNRVLISVARNNDDLLLFEALKKTRNE